MERDLEDNHQRGQRAAINQASPLPLCVRVSVATGMIGVGRTKFYELIAAGEIEAIKLGNATLIPTASLQALIDRRRKSGVTQPTI
jgi:excisionase family DNA binding protein